MALTDKSIDVAPLETVKLAQLTAKDPSAVSKLLKAASSCGFFFLDLQSEGLPENLNADVPKIYTLSDQYFEQSHEQKMKDYREDQLKSQDPR